MLNYRKNAGFTLIELLVVISIIGLLSSIVLAVLADARSRGCDARRLAELAQINTAIQLYIDDNGEAPPTTESVTSDEPAWDDLAELLEPYITLPTDPCPGRTPFEDISVDAYQAEGFAYAYRRMDDWYGSCRSGEISDCDPTGYILDVVSFEKRDKDNDWPLYVYAYPN